MAWKGTCLPFSCMKCTNIASAFAIAKVQAHLAGARGSEQLDVLGGKPTPVEDSSVAVDFPRR